MSPSCIQLFEQELQRRGISFARDGKSGRHVIERADGTRLLLSLDNLIREFERDKDTGCILRFIDMAQAGGGWVSTWGEAHAKLFLGSRAELLCGAVRSGEGGKQAAGPRASAVRPRARGRDLGQ